MNLFLNFYFILTYSNHVYLLANSKEVVDCNEANSNRINEKLLERTNYYRSLHSVDPLTLDDKLILGASAQSRKIIKNEVPDSPSEEYGENTYNSLGTGSYDNSKLDVIEIWYHEIRDYQNEYNDRTKNFTQLVWKDTKKMGCAVCTKKATDTFIICRFSPRGNIKESFAQNVLPVKEAPIALAQIIVTPNDGAFSLYLNNSDDIPSQSPNVGESPLQQLNNSDNVPSKPPSVSEFPLQQLNNSDNVPSQLPNVGKFPLELNNSDDVTLRPSVTILYDKGDTIVESVTTQSHMTIGQTDSTQISTSEVNIRTWVQILAFATLGITFLGISSLVTLIVKHKFWR